MLSIVRIGKLCSYKGIFLPQERSFPSLHMKIEIF